MKRSLFAALGLCLLGGVLLPVTPVSGLAPQPAPQTRPSDAAASRPATAPATLPANIIKVATAEEFVAAIGSDRTIELTSPEYILTDVKNRPMDFVRWDHKLDGLSMTIRNVKNLSIVNPGEKTIRLIVRPGYVFVLNFEKCQSIRLTHLTLGHAPQKGACASGVVGATDCSDLVFEGCDLFGCGTEGLTLENVKGLEFQDSVIRECTYGIMTAKGCTDLAFTHSRFTDNEQYWGMKISDCKGVAFKDCVIAGNTVEDGPLIATSSSTEVRFDGGAIRANQADGLGDGENHVAIHNARIERNRFEKRSSGR